MYISIHLRDYYEEKYLYNHVVIHGSLLRYSTNHWRSINQQAHCISRLKTQNFGLKNWDLILNIFKNWEWSFQT